MSSRSSAPTSPATRKETSPPIARRRPTQLLCRSSGVEYEAFAAREASAGLTERSAHDLTPSSLGLEAEIALVLIHAAHFEARNQETRYGKLIALALVDREVERVSAAFLLITVLRQAVIFDGR